MISRRILAARAETRTPCAGSEALRCILPILGGPVHSSGNRPGRNLARYLRRMGLLPMMIARHITHYVREKVPALAPLPRLPYTRRVLSTHITTVILDFGGVLGMPQDADRVAAMASLCGLSRERFMAAYPRDRLELDRGTLSAAEYWTRIMAIGGVAPTTELIERIEREDALGWTRINHHMVGWAAELRAAGYRTGILSNMPPDKLSFMRSSGGFAWIEDFNAALFSCEYGMVKPEPEFFRLCLSKLAVSPEDCVFLDDSAVNVEGARAMGMHAMVFRSAHEAATELAHSWGLPVSSLMNGAGA